MKRLDENDPKHGWHHGLYFCSSLCGTLFTEHPIEKFYNPVLLEKTHGFTLTSSPIGFVSLSSLNRSALTSL